MRNSPLRVAYIPSRELYRRTWHQCAEFAKERLRWLYDHALPVELDPIIEEGSFGTGVLDGGRTQVVDLQLKKGKYAVLCFVPDRKGGEPHAFKGMISEAVVQ